MFQQEVHKIGRGRKRELSKYRIYLTNGLCDDDCYIWHCDRICARTSFNYKKINCSTTNMPRFLGWYCPCNPLFWIWLVVKSIYIYIGLVWWCSCCIWIYTSIQAIEIGSNFSVAGKTPLQRVVGCWLYCT